MNRPRADQLSGYTIRGFKVEELLGIGQVTAVYRVRNQQDETRTLTVLIQPERFTEEVSERFLLRFDQLAPALSSLKHPHIVPLLGWGQQEGYPYLLLPDMSARPLVQELREHGPFSLAYAVAVIERIADGLEFAHGRGVLHLGLCPARIFLVEESFVQIAGFGLVSLLQRHGIEDDPDDTYGHLRTIAGTFMEPAEFLAPEIVQGATGSSRTDVYALGILLFEMLCGHPPFQRGTYLEVARKHVYQPLPPLHTQRADVPLALELVLHQALKRDPDQRFEHPRDLAAACMRVLTRRPFTTITMAREQPCSSSFQEGGSEREPVTASGFGDSGVRVPPAAAVGAPAVRDTGSPDTDQAHHPQGRVRPASLASNGKRTAAENDRPSQGATAAFFDAFEGLPPPSYGGDGLHALAQVPTGREETKLSVRGAMEELLDEVLSRSPRSPIQRNRRRFHEMFPYL